MNRNFAIRRTVVRVELLRQGCSVEDEEGINPYDLTALQAVLKAPNCIGNIDVEVDDELVLPEDVEEELIRIGNDGTFFDDPFCFQVDTDPEVV